MTNQPNHSIGNAALEKIREAGAYEVVEHPDNTRVIVLPSCTVPTKYLYPGNWDRTIDGGNFREVRQIIAACGKEFDHEYQENTLFAKSPEKRFVASNNFAWWGGPRSGQTYVGLFDEPVVNELAYWEGVFLLALWKAGIPVEEPQAIVDFNEGEKVQIVTKGINDVRVWWHRKKKDPIRDIEKVLKEQVCALGIDPEDFQTLSDIEGKTWVFDAARWAWPPYTDRIREQIKNLVIQRSA